MENPVDGVVGKRISRIRHAPHALRHRLGLFVAQATLHLQPAEAGVAQEIAGRDSFLDALIAAEDRIEVAGPLRLGLGEVIWIRRNHFVESRFVRHRQRRDAAAIGLRDPEVSGRDGRRRKRGAAVGPNPVVGVLSFPVTRARQHLVIESGLEERSTDRTAGCSAG